MLDRCDIQLSVVHIGAMRRPRYSTPVQLQCRVHAALTRAAVARMRDVIGDRRCKMSTYVIFLRLYCLDCFPNNMLLQIVHNARNLRDLRELATVTKQKMAECSPQA